MNFCDKLFSMKMEKGKERNRKTKFQKKKDQKKHDARTESRSPGRWFPNPSTNQRTTLVNKFP